MSIHTVPDRLRKAADLFAERDKTYGSNYKGFGRVMKALFPFGIGEDHTVEELSRLVMISHFVTKLGRYCQSFQKGGHADSLEDLAVYAMMCAELDEEAKSQYKGLKRIVVEDPPETEKNDEWVTSAEAG